MSAAIGEGMGDRDVDTIPVGRTVGSTVPACGLGHLLVVSKAGLCNETPELLWYAALNAS